MEGEKTPKEYLADNNYELALKGYLTIQQKDSLNSVIKEKTLNSTGYIFLEDK